jgi:hypothetical protein
MRAYYFASEDRKLRFGDGRAISVSVTHKHEGAVVLCERGLHAARTPFEALQYAPGPILYLVRLGGVIVEGDDKVVAAERTYLAEFDATELSRIFARQQAMKHIELIRPFCSRDAYAAIVAYLRTGEEGCREAARAAAEAAWAAVWAAEAAVEAAAWAARAAAEAARAAAWAARAAARAAVWAAEAAAEAAGAAAWAAEAAAEAARAAAWAARAAARAAAIEESAAEFNVLVKEATGWEF